MHLSPLYVSCCYVKLPVLKTFNIYVVDCAKGKYGNKCSYSCSKYCAKEECHPLNGNCNCSSPANRHGGPGCNLLCTDSCGNEGCNQDMKCRGCKPGLWGSYCTKRCPDHCRVEDGVTYGCLQNNGDCNLCEGGYFNIKCETSCPAYCNGTCEKISGDCPCETGMYGAHCNETCSANCETSRCQKSDGQCKCKPGYKTGCETGK